MKFVRDGDKRGMAFTNIGLKIRREQNMYREEEDITIEEARMENLGYRWTGEQEEWR